MRLTKMFSYAPIWVRPAETAAVITAAPASAAPSYSGPDGLDDQQMKRMSCPVTGYENLVKVPRLLQAMLVIASLVVFGVVAAGPASAGTQFGCTTHAAYPYRHDVSEMAYSGSVTCTGGRYGLVTTITNEYFRHSTDTNPTKTFPIRKKTCGYGGITSCSVSDYLQPYLGSGYYCTVTQGLVIGEGAIPAARHCSTY